MTDTPAAGDEPNSQPDGLGALLRDGLLRLVRTPRLGRRGVRLLVAIVVIGWAATSIYRVQPDEQGVVLRFGRWIDTTQPGLHVHLPFPIDTVLFPKVTQINQVQLGNPRRARRPGERARAADADRRREHRRGGLRGVLEDPRRRRVPVPRQRARGGGEDRRRRRAARRHQPHADPGGDVRQAPADRRRDQGGAAVAARFRARRHRDHPGPAASASSRRWR